MPEKRYAKSVYFKKIGHADLNYKLCCILLLLLNESNCICRIFFSFGQTGQTSRNDHLGSRKTAMTLHGYDFKEAG